MADAGARKAYRNVVSSCDHQALKECLDRNNGDRSKCIKEWEDFQRSCAENKSSCFPCLYCVDFSVVKMMMMMMVVVGGGGGGDDDDDDDYHYY
ncbi:unnamed protein product [Porites evermanni]|uniref:Uncharacterized protein n=1 Tax=Porites evermanni TaxID=104178 RepID=A0ABN8LT09_9CNID|nr:unnamed protein product [Porites evermanni]